ncbi:MAG: GNAT family N-acetyltransferase [Lachnospiraceae bacterium]|nr:GNAT family N-acetyltransferase [Lachnospiraceae bacterium]
MGTEGSRVERVRGNMRFLQADEKDKEEILLLYREAIGSAGCIWSEEYPNEAILEDDIRRNALFCMKDEMGEILGALSMDEDPEVDALENWSFRKEDGVKAAEIARLVVKEAYRNRKLAGRMFECLLERLRDEGFVFAYFLVAQENERAIRAYRRLAFSERGEAELFGEKWFCFEKRLTDR